MPISRLKVDVCTSWGKVSAGWYIFFRFCWFGMFIEIYWTNSTIWGTMLAFISMSFPYWVLSFNLTSDIIIFFGFLFPNLESEYSCVSWDLNCILTASSLLIYVHLLPVSMSILVSSLCSISGFLTFASAVFLTIFFPTTTRLFSCGVNFRQFHFFQFQVSLLFQISLDTDFDGVFSSHDNERIPGSEAYILLPSELLSSIWSITLSRWTKFIRLQCSVIMSHRLPQKTKAIIIILNTFSFLKWCACDFWFPVSCAVIYLSRLFPKVLAVHSSFLSFFF